MRLRCSALPTELPKPHESSRVWVRPFMFSARNARLKYINSMDLAIDVQPTFFISVHLIEFTAEYILSSCLFVCLLVCSYGFYAILNT